MIQIGETVYPNIGYNALQRKPGSFINIQIAAIDDSWQRHHLLAMTTIFSIYAQTALCKTGLDFGPTII